MALQRSWDEMLVCHRITRVLLLLLVIVIVFPHSTNAVECTAHILFSRSINRQVTGEFSATTSASEPYPRLRTANVNVGLFGIRSDVLCENTSNSGDNSYYADASGTFELNNIVFSSDGTEPVPVTLNLDLDGRFNLLDQAGTRALGIVQIDATINGTSFPGEIHVCTMYCVEIQTGLLDGVMGRSYPNLYLTTPEVVVPVNQPVTVEISMINSITVDGTAHARGEGVFNSSFSFARTGPVFNVPAGITVNSEHAVIVDNLYYSGNTVPVKNSTWGAIKELYR
jgi:hypothetical protein